MGIYVENSEEVALEICGLNVGVTHIKWSPCGNKLWIGGRKHSRLSCWDVRMLKSEIGCVERELETNQRLSFDIDPWGQYLFTGSQHGEYVLCNYVILML